MIIKVLKFIYINFFSPVYKRMASQMAYIAYIPEPFFKKGDKAYMNQHQNRRETLIIDKIFDELGYGVYVERFDKFYFSKRKKYDLVFGIDPNFDKIALANPFSKKIYYATGAYYEHQNMMIKNRTDDSNLKKGTNFSYQRLVPTHQASEIADAIIQIGSKYTIETYPKHLQSKIILIRQTGHTFKNFIFENKIPLVKKYNFLWMGSAGSILKGLDLVLDFFLEHPEYNIYMIGKIDSDFYDFYKDRMSKLPNIRYLGFLDMDDPMLIEIANKCIAIIFPSGSEGQPGSVLNMMKLGLIPIVSRWSAVNNIDSLGYRMESLTVSEIGKGVNYIQSLSEEEYINKCRANYEYAIKNYNSDCFYIDMKSAIKQVLNL